MTTPNQEAAFEEWWRQHHPGCPYDHYCQDDQAEKRAFHAGAKAGAKAERERVLAEADKLLDRRTGYDVADDALDAAREAIQKLRDTER